MGRRKRIGVLFQYDDSWTGGIYYLFNIIRALDRLSEAEKPHLVFFYRYPEIIDRLKELEYPYCEFLPIDKSLSLSERIVRRCYRIFINKGFQYQAQYPRTIVDFIYPCDSAVFNEEGSLKRVKKVYWIADFQHKHLPNFFSKEQIDHRESVFTGIARLDVPLILSSEAARTDFERFYPGHYSRVRVVPFATVLPAFEETDILYLKEKFDIRSEYFISPNQFWVHKNHLVLLKAALLLKNTDLQFQVLLTGKEYDFRFPGYTDELKTFVEVNGLGHIVKFLGFLDRREQLQLMNSALAVIQPSLFEGWSTVVEDAKALNKSLIVSDIPVHAEQCDDRAVYFDPNDANELAAKMRPFLNEFKDRGYIDYSKNIVRFAHDILALDKV